MYTICQGRKAFSVKSQIINILGFEGFVVCVATTQLYHCVRKIAIDNA